MVKNVVKNVMSINALVQRHLSSTSSSSSFLITAKTPEKTLFQPGFVFYGKKRSKFPKKRFFIQDPFFIQPCTHPPPICTACLQKNCGGSEQQTTTTTPANSHIPPEASSTSKSHVIALCSYPAVRFQIHLPPPPPVTLSESLQ